MTELPFRHTAFTMAVLVAKALEVVIVVIVVIEIVLTRLSVLVVWTSGLVGAVSL